MAVDLAHVLREGQFFVDRESYPNVSLLLVGDGETPLGELKPVGVEPDRPPDDGQVYGMCNGVWVPQVLMGDDAPIVVPPQLPPGLDGYVPTATDSVIGYIIGPSRSANGADVHICDHKGQVFTPNPSYFQGHKPWSLFEDVQDGNNAMVKVPRYWYKKDVQPVGLLYAGCPRFMISSYPIEGWECDGSVYKDTSGNDVDFFLFGKYRARSVGGAGVSQSAGQPVGNINIRNLQAACEANGAGYHLSSYQEWCAIFQLAIIEKGTFQLYHEGVRRDPVACRYHGIEEFCFDTGSLWAEWVSGIESNAASLTKLWTRDGLRNWNQTSKRHGSVAASNYFITALHDGPDEANYFLGASLGAEGVSLIPDRAYSDANMVACLNFSSGASYGGAFYLHLGGSASGVNVAIGGRPAKVGS